MHLRAMYLVVRLEMLSRRGEGVNAKQSVTIIESLQGGSLVNETLTPLILDFLEWIAAKPRSYSEAMDAWRTSCPKLTVWEDANDRGFVAQRSVAGEESLVELTAKGRAFLERNGRLTNLSSFVVPATETRS
jgi:hypothetical protein